MNVDNGVFYNVFESHISYSFFKFGNKEIRDYSLPNHGNKNLDICFTGESKAIFLAN